MNDSTPIPEGYKRCSKCNEIFPSSPMYFYRNSKKKDGFCPECKSCHNICYKGVPMLRWPPQTDIERFWSHVAEPNERGCKLWTAGHYEKGYGQFGVNSTQVLAHRFAWELTYGPIPVGLFVCHTCDNPPCCNPEHLFLGRDLDNIADMMKKERNNRGEDRYNAKLTEEKVKDIRKAYATGGYTYQSLADIHGVTFTCIQSAVIRRTWKHVK